MSDNQFSQKNVKSLHFAFIMLGAYGHIIPTLPLIKALTEMGHRVSYFNISKFKNQIEAAGAAFVDYNSILPEVPHMDHWDGGGIYPGLNAITKEVGPVLAKFKEANDDIDLVIYDQVAPWGKIFAKQYQLPSVCACTMLLASSQEWDLVCPRGRNSIEGVKDKYFSYQEMLDCLSAADAENIIAYTSAEFQPKYKSPNIIFYGNRFEYDYQPSLKEFTDESVIYISLGTIYNCNSGLFIKLIKLFDNTNYQIVASTGGNEEVFETLNKQTFGKNVKIHKFVNQFENLAKASVFITHAGASAVSEAIYFTTPMLMIPSMEEHYNNACKAEALHLGYHLDSKDISIEQLQEAFNNIKQNWQTYKSSLEEMRNTFLASLNAKEVAHRFSSLALTSQKAA